MRAAVRDGIIDAFDAQRDKGTPERAVRRLVEIL
jgi:hypothetical protein